MNVGSKEEKSFKTYNMAKVDRLFQANAVLIDGMDVVPLHRSVELFGIEAVEKTDEPGRDYDIFGVGENTITVLYKHGFYKAAAFYNAVAVTQEEGYLKYGSRAKMLEVIE